MEPSGPSVKPAKPAKATQGPKKELQKDAKAAKTPNQMVSAMAHALKVKQEPVPGIVPQKVSAKAPALKVKQEPVPATVPVIKTAPLDEDSDDNVAISSAKPTRVHQVPFGNQSQSKFPTVKANPEACKPEKPPAAPKGRKPLVPKDRAPLIAGDARIFTDRTGEDWMDGHLSLINLVSKYIRPFNECIPSDQLSMENMPPFFVRLRDDQVGHLLDWISDKSRVSIQPTKAASYWPWDLTSSAALAQTRENWGKAYTGRVPQGKLPGGPEAPEYTNPGLPLTYTSLGKAMCRDESATATAADDTGSNGKRKASEAMGELGVGNAKRVCAWATPETREEVMQTFVDKIEKLKAEHKLEIEALEATISEKESSIADLQRQKNEAIATIQAHNEVVAVKDTEIQKLNVSVTDKTKIITSVESTLTEMRVKVDKLEARIKRQNTDLQKCRKDLAEEIRKHIAWDIKKNKEVKDAKKDLRDANTKIKSLQATIADKGKALESEKQEIEGLKKRIEYLEQKSTHLLESISHCRDFFTSRLAEIGVDNNAAEKEKVAEKGDTGGAEDPASKTIIGEKKAASGQGH